MSEDFRAKKEGDKIGTKIIYAPNRKLDDEEAMGICKKIGELYEQGFWVEQQISLNKAGTIIILVKKKKFK